MKNTFTLSAKNNLNKTGVEVPAQKIDKNLLMSFKASSDLNNQLYKQRKKNSNKIFVDGAKELLKQAKIMKSNEKFLVKKSQQEQLSAEVIALSHYKAPVTREKTRLLVEKITTNKRQKHINALSQFKLESEQYLNSVKDIYESIKIQGQQFMRLNTNDIKEFINNLTDEELLKKQKQIINEIRKIQQQNKFKRIDKIQYIKSNFSSFQTERTQKISEICKQLNQKIFDIAFVLQSEAKEISNQKFQELKVIQNNEQKQNNLFIDKLNTSQEQQFSKLALQLKDKEIKWKTLKSDQALKLFEKDMNSPYYNNSDERKKYYSEIKQNQNKYHKQRQNLLIEVMSSNPQKFTKANMDKYSEILKTKNDQSNIKIDEIFAKLLKQIEQSQKRGLKRLDQLKQRLKYIGLNSQQEIQKILSQKCLVLVNRNQQNGKKLLSDATAFVQKYDSRQNQICQNVFKFINKIANKNDQNKKKYDTAIQNYQLKKAKILDDDEDKVQKLNQELEILKKQLRQSLHHLKLDEIEKKCTKKIDQLEENYRKTHEENKKLVNDHPAQIQKFIIQVQNQNASIFQLFQQTKRNQLLEKYKKQAEEKVLKKIQIEDKKKAQEQLKIAQQNKKKGGKNPPPSKPKDPKKVAAELQERKQALLKQYGPIEVKQYKSPTGKTWLIFKSVEQIGKNFYLFQEQKKEGQKLQVLNNEMDSVQAAIRDIEGNQIVSTNVIFKKNFIFERLSQLRDKIFTYVADQKVNLKKIASQNDKEFLDNSLQILDGRLKAHYSLKGKLQSEVYIKRSTQITSHKKKYQRYARTTKEKMDSQTQKYNFLLQKSFELTKAHNEEQKKTKQQLPSMKNLSQLQGLYAKYRQNSHRFDQNIKQIIKQLQRLSGIQVENLLSKNIQFIQQSKQIEKGGEYSKQELDWYKSMMNQITTQLTQQKQKRLEKMKQIQNHTNKRRQQLLDIFQKQYNIIVQDLAARDGSGKKYGRPKRSAQEKIRMEMNKCQKSQQNLLQLLNNFKKQLNNPISESTKPKTSELRRLLMKLRVSIGRYAKHIDAIKPDAKINEIIRISYNEEKPDLVLIPAELQEDQKRKSQQLAVLGPLSQQKDEKKFNQLIDEIEKLIKQEATKIYVGDKAKYLTGTDKIPDYLRSYIATMKKNTQNFRLNCIRDLRSICIQLNELCQKISNKFYDQIIAYFIRIKKQAVNMDYKAFKQFQKDMETTKQINLKKLRPNLINPACKQQLSELNQSEIKRITQCKLTIKKYKDTILDKEFKIASRFLNYCLNNFQFLIIYYDSLYLYQDFIKLPGDEISEKNHLNIKDLLLFKQKGSLIDTNSQRNITKKWQGVRFNMFDFADKKFQYIKTIIQEPKVEKKGAKKQAKDSKKQQQQQSVQDPNATITKQIQSIKTWRQKSAFIKRNQTLQSFKKVYDDQVKQMIKVFEQAEENQKGFEVKWKKIVEQFEKGMI